MKINTLQQYFIAVQIYRKKVRKKAKPTNQNIKARWLWAKNLARLKRTRWDRNHLRNAAGKIFMTIVKMGKMGNVGAGICSSID